jgi:hypothetical protein
MYCSDDVAVWIMIIRLEDLSRSSWNVSNGGANVGFDRLEIKLPM